MGKKTKKYDERGNTVYYENSDGNGVWCKYDNRDNQIYYKTNIHNVYDFECWREYDEDNNEIHYKDSDLIEFWYKWINNENIQISQKEFEQIEFLSRKKVNRCEIMDI